MNTSHSYTLRETYEILFDKNARKTYVWILLGILLAFGAEIGSFTFSSDYFYNLAHASSPPTSYSYDGRFLAEIIFFTIFNGVYAPTLFLIIGLVLLSITAVILASIWKFKSAHVLVVSALLISLHPFFLENFSYINTRFVVPLAILLSVIGIVSGGISKDIFTTVKSLVFILASLFLYQSSVNFAAVAVLIWAAIVIVEQNSIRVAFTQILIPKLSAIIIAVIIYRLLLRLAGSRTVRFESFYRLPENTEELINNILFRLESVFDYHFSASAFFPQSTKYLLLLILFLFLAGLVIRVSKRDIGYKNALVVVILLILAAAATHGITLPFIPAQRFLVYRILFPFSALTLGVFLLAHKVNGNLIRNSTSVIAALVILSFIVQANSWHQFLFLKNLADLDMTQRISNSLKSNPDYAADLPLVIVGTSDLPYYSLKEWFSFPHSSIAASMTSKSTYSHDWSKDRWLKFFLRFRIANDGERRRAVEHTKSMPIWPHQNSVAIKEGVMIVNLSSVH